MARLLGALTALVVTMVAMASDARAETDQLCVSQASGVPGPQVKHPEWWNPALNADTRETRWTGATRIYDSGSVSPDIASGRVIWDQPSSRLFFQFDVDGDPTLDAAYDLVTFVVSDSTGATPDLYIQFDPMNDCAASPATCAGLGKAMSGSSIQYSQATDTGTSISWSTLSTINPSATWTVTNPWVELQQNSSTYKWVVKFALTIPTDPGTGEALANQRFYSNTLMYMQGATSGTIVEFPLLCKPSNPASNDCQIVSSGMPALPGAIPVGNMSTTWAHVTTGSISSCDGVEAMRLLSGSNFRMPWGIIPGTSVRAKFPTQWLPYFSGAKLRAGFHNDTANALNIGDVSADFRIASWGLRWRGPTAPGTNWNWIAAANLDGVVTAGGYGGAQNEGKIQTAKWVPMLSGLTFTSPIQTLHVQLTSNVGGVNFKRDSVYRNMVLVPASVFRRPADLDLSGRALPNGQQAHQVYLLERTFHMPTVADCLADSTQIGCPDGPDMHLEDVVKNEIGQPVQQLDQQQQVEQQQVEQQQNQAGVQKGDAAPVGQYATVGLSLDQLPRYSLHAMVDSGETLDLPGAPGTKVLHHFAALGYHVTHEGAPSQGFEYFLHARDAVPVPGLPDLHELSIGEDMVTSIATTIRVIDGVQHSCAKPPEPHEYMPAQEAQAQAQAMYLQAQDGSLAKNVVVDTSFGCDPPPQRAECAEGDCPWHNPMLYVEGSRHVGEFNDAEMAGLELEVIKAMGMPKAATHDDGTPEGLAAAQGEGDGSDGEFDGELDDELTDLPDGAQGFCMQASVDPQASRRGAAGTAGLVGLILLLRRGRRRRRRRTE